MDNYRKFMKPMTKAVIHSIIVLLRDGSENKLLPFLLVTLWNLLKDTL